MILGPVSALVRRSASLALLVAVAACGGEGGAGQGGADQGGAGQGGAGQGGAGAGSGTAPKVPEWAARWGSSGDEYAGTLLAAGPEHRVLVGSYQGAAAIAGMPLPEVDDPAGLGFFVLRFAAADGALGWLRTFEDVSAAAVDAPDDASGSRAVYLSGYLEAPHDFGGGPLEPGNWMAKLDADGQHVWAFNHEPVGVRALEVAPGGDLLVAGSFPGSEVTLRGATASSSGSDGFVARLSAEDGSAEWIHASSLSSSDGFEQVHGDGGRVYAVGATVSSELALAAFDGATGDELWARTYPGGVAFHGSKLSSALAAGVIVVAGAVGKSADFGCGPLGTTGGFLAGFSAADGTCLWSTPYGHDAIRSLVRSADGEAIVASGPVLIRPADGSRTSFELGSEIFLDLAVLDAAGYLTVAHTTPNVSDPEPVDLGVGPLAPLGGSDIVVGRFPP